MELRDFCSTERQRQILDAVVAAKGSTGKAAKQLGIHRRNVERAMHRIREQAVARGWSPEHSMVRSVPENFHVARVSTNYDQDGQVRQQWVIGKPNKDQELRMLVDAAHLAFEDFAGTSTKSEFRHQGGTKKKIDKERLTIYPMGDPHIGMYAWHEETGEDFNLDIATRDLTAAVRNLVERSPATEVGILLNLGDFFHADNMQNSTMRSGNSLDVDSRWQKVLRLGIRAMIDCVDAALEKHKVVVVKNMIGNHDDHSSHFLSIGLDMYYSNNDRVVVDTSPSKFWYYDFGSVLIGSTHGDTTKFKDLPNIMAADQAKAWGNSEHRYWYTGHIHTRNREEYAGCVVESFRTLAARDAWHTAEGYRAGRDMQSIVLHRDHGEVERHTISITQLKNAK